MANTEQIEAKLCAYVDGELDAAGRAEIEAHLQANPQHRQLLAELVAQRDLLRGLPRDRAPEDLFDAFQTQLERSVLLDRTEPDVAVAGKINRWPQILSVAAVLALALGLAAVIVLVVLPTNRNARPDYARVATPTAPTTRGATPLLREGAGDDRPTTLAAAAPVPAREFARATAPDAPGAAPAAPAAPGVPATGAPAASAPTAVAAAPDVPFDPPAIADARRSRDAMYKDAADGAMGGGGGAGGTGAVAQDQRPYSPKGEIFGKRAETGGAGGTSAGSGSVIAGAGGTGAPAADAAAAAANPNDIFAQKQAAPAGQTGQGQVADPPVVGNFFANPLDPETADRLKRSPAVPEHSELVVVATNDPTATNGLVVDYLARNNIRWEAVTEPMPAPVAIAPGSAMASKMQQQRLDVTEPPGAFPAPPVLPQSAPPAPATPPAPDQDGGAAKAEVAKREKAKDADGAGAPAPARDPARAVDAAPPPAPPSGAGGYAAGAASPAAPAPPGAAPAAAPAPSPVQGPVPGPDAAAVAEPPAPNAPSQARQDATSSAEQQQQQQLQQQQPAPQQPTQHAQQQVFPNDALRARQATVGAATQPGLTHVPLQAGSQLIVARGLTRQQVAEVFACAQLQPDNRVSNYRRAGDIIAPATQLAAGGYGLGLRGSAASVPNQAAVVAAPQRAPADAAGANATMSTTQNGAAAGATGSVAAAMPGAAAAAELERSVATPLPAQPPLVTPPPATQPLDPVATGGAASTQPLTPLPVPASVAEQRLTAAAVAATQPSATQSVQEIATSAVAAPATQPAPAAEERLDVVIVLRPQELPIIAPATNAGPSAPPASAGTPAEIPTTSPAPQATWPDLPAASPVLPPAPAAPVAPPVTPPPFPAR